MYKRIIYPGKIDEKEIILVTGSIYGADISSFITSLAEGVKSDGYTVSICSPGAVRSHCQSDQFGNPADWDLNYDVILVDFGEYLGGKNFRHGFLDSLPFTRTVFITPLAENALCQSKLLSFEEEQRHELMMYLIQHLPQTITLARPSLSRMSSGERMIAETNNEILLAIENGEQPDQDLIEKRKVWKSSRVIDQIPKLERRLW